MKCPNCGEDEAHFVPPSMGEEGFFICTKKVVSVVDVKEKQEQEKEKDKNKCH